MRLLATLALAGAICAAHPAEARKAHHRDNLAPVPVAGAMIDDRYPNLRLPEAYASARAWKRPAKQVRRHVVRRHVPIPLPKPRPKSLASGLVEEVRQALPAPKGLAGIVPTLAAKASEIIGACPGARVISAVRHTYVAGTRRISLHASGKAVDVTGNPGCIYARLRGWPGGYSVDYARVRHVHVSYDAQGHREWGARFYHNGGTMSARRHRYHHRHRRKSHA